MTVAEKLESWRRRRSQTVAANDAELIALAEWQKKGICYAWGIERGKKSVWQIDLIWPQAEGQLFS